MATALEGIDDFFGPAASMLGLYNAEERASDKEPIQALLQGHMEQMWREQRNVGEEMSKLKVRLQFLDKRVERLSKDVTRIVGKQDHKTVQHRWQQVMRTYSKHCQRIRDLLRMFAELGLGEDGLLYPLERADEFSSDVLGTNEGLSVKECLFHIHHMIIGGTIFCHAPLFKTYHELVYLSKLRHQSIRWHVQVYMSHVVAVELAGMLLHTTALNILGRHDDLRNFQEEMKVRLEEQDRLIKEVSAASDPVFFSSSPVEKMSVTYVDARDEVRVHTVNGDAKSGAANETVKENGEADNNEDTDSWGPIMGLQLYRKQEGLLSVKHTVMQCPAVAPSRQWGPPKLTKVIEQPCEIPIGQRSNVLAQCVTLAWSRVKDPLTECICGVRFVTEPPITEENNNDDEPDVTEKPPITLGLECIVYSKNNPDEVKYILPPHFDHDPSSRCILTRGGQGKRLNLFPVDVGQVLPKQPGWMTGVRLHMRENVLSLGIETSYW